jgi:hypothetical protein
VTRTKQEKEKEKKKTCQQTKITSSKKRPSAKRARARYFITQKEILGRTAFPFLAWTLCPLKERNKPG